MCNRHMSKLDFVEGKLDGPYQERGALRELLLNACRDLESFSDFVARLTQAVRRQIQHEAAGDILIQQLAYENANADCKECLMPLRKNSTITDIIQACQNVGSGTFQANLLTAAVIGGNRRRYKCGKAGHFQKRM